MAAGSTSVLNGAISRTCRAGYAYGWMLFYATAGLAYGETKFDSAGVTDPHTSLGWTIGTGVEFAFTPCWSVKAEYLYYNLGPQTYCRLASRRLSRRKC
jgi:outer membrane immunogenic protein